MKEWDESDHEFKGCDELDDEFGETYLSLRAQAMFRSVDVVGVSGGEVALRVKIDRRVVVVFRESAAKKVR